jgi:hypothetical protein
MNIETGADFTIEMGSLTLILIYGFRIFGRSKAED